MPVARIITTTPQDAELVAGCLRGQGYTVEIVAPGAPQRGGADLEVQLETCDPEEALGRAGELAKTGADVFVTAGTFVIADPIAAPVEEQQQAIGPAEPPVRPVWRPESESAAERSTLIHDLAQMAAPTIAAAARRMRQLTVAGAAHARELASMAIARGRTLMRDAAAAIAVRFARFSEQRRHAQERRQQQAKMQRAVVSRAVAPSRPQAQPPRLPVIRRTRSRDYEWRTAGIFSLALAVGITLAWAAANRRPATPVPTSVIVRSNSLEQQVPFGPVTLPPPAKLRQQAAKKPKPLARKPAAQHQADTSDNEVVVRHLTPARTPPPSRPAVAVRRIVVND